MELYSFISAYRQEDADEDFDDSAVSQVSLIALPRILFILIIATTKLSMQIF